MPIICYNLNQYNSIKDTKKIEYNHYIQLINNDKIKQFLNNNIQKSTHIVNIRSYLNKITDINYESIQMDILQLCNTDMDKQELLSIMVDLLSDTNIHIDKYIDIIKSIDNINLIEMIQNYFALLNKPSSSYYQESLSQQENMYTLNNYNSKLIGFTKFMIYLEDNHLIHGYTHIIINKLIEKIKKNLNNNIFHVYINCLHSIYQLLHIPNYKQYLSELKEINKCIQLKKYKFKLQDIIDMYVKTE